MEHLHGRYEDFFVTPKDLQDDSNKDDEAQLNNDRPNKRMP